MEYEFLLFIGKNCRECNSLYQKQHFERDCYRRNALCCRNVEVMYIDWNFDLGLICSINKINYFSLCLRSKETQIHK